MPPRPCSQVASFIHRQAFPEPSRCWHLQPGHGPGCVHSLAGSKPRKSDPPPPSHLSCAGLCGWGRQGQKVTFTPLSPLPVSRADITNQMRHYFFLRSNSAPCPGVRLFPGRTQVGSCQRTCLVLRPSHPAGPSLLQKPRASRPGSAPLPGRLWGRTGQAHSTIKPKCWAQHPVHSRGPPAGFRQRPPQAGLTTALPPPSRQ